MTQATAHALVSDAFVERVCSAVWGDYWTEMDQEDRDLARKEARAHLEAGLVEIVQPPHHYTQISAGTLINARRIQSVLRDDYDTVYVARDIFAPLDEQWSVLYTDRKAAP